MPLPPSTSSIALRYLEAIDCANHASSLLEYAGNQNQSIKRSTTTSAITTTTPQTKSTTTLTYPLSPPTSRWIAPDDNAIANRSLLADVPSTQTYTPTNNKILGTPSSGIMTATTVMTPSGSGSWTSSHSTHYKNRFRLTSATTTPTTATNTTVATSPSQRRRPRTWQQQQQLQQQLAMMNDTTTLPENPVVVVATHHHHHLHAHHTNTTAGEYSDESSLTSRRSETNEEDNGGYQQHHQDSSSLATNEDYDDDDNEDGNDHRIEDDDEEDDPRSAPWTSPQQKQTLLHQSRFSNLPRRQLDGVKQKNTPNLQAQHRKDPASTTRKAATNRLSDASWIKKKKRGPNDRSSVTPPLPQPTTPEPDNQLQPPPSSHDEGVNQQLAPPTISALTANNVNASIQPQASDLQQRPESATDQMSDFMAPTEIMTNRTTDLQYRRRGLRRPRPSQLQPLPPPQLSATTVIPRPNADEHDEHQLQLMTSGFTCSAIPQHYFGQNRTSKTPSAGAVARGINPTTPTKTVSSSSSRNGGSSSNNPSTDSFGGRPWPPPSTSPRSSLFPRSFPQRHVETNSLLSDSSIEGGGSSAAIMGDAANTSATTNTSTTNTTNTNTAATTNSAAAIALPDKPEVKAAAKTTTAAAAAALPTPFATNARPFRLPPAAAQSRKPPTASSSSVYQSSLPQPQQQESTSAVGAGINRNGSFQSQSITSSVGVETGVKTVEPSSVALKTIFTHRTAQSTLRSRTMPIPPQAPAPTATPAVATTATAQLQSRYKSTNASGRSSSSPPPPQPQQQDLRLPEFLQCHRLMSHRGSKSDGVLVAKTGRGEPIQAAQSHTSSGWTPMSESGLISEDFSPSRPVQPLFFSNRIFEDSGTSPSKAFQHWMSKQNENRNESSGKALSEPSYPRSRSNYFGQQAARQREKNDKEQFDEDESKNGPPEVQRITRVDRSLNEIGGWNRTAATGKSSNQKVSVMGENPDPIFCPASPQETRETLTLPPSTVIESNHRQVTQYDQTGDPQVHSLTPIRALLARRRQQRQWPPQEFTTRDETAEEKKGETEDSPFRISTHTMTTPPDQSVFSSTRIDTTSQFDGEGLTNKTKSIPKESVTVRSEPDNAKKSPLNQAQGFSRSTLRSHALNRYSLRKKELGIEKASNEKVLVVKPSSKGPNVSPQEIRHQSLRSKLYGSASLITSPVARSPVAGKQNEQPSPVARAPEKGKRNEQEPSKSDPTSKVTRQPEVPPPTSKGTVQEARSRFQHSLKSSQPTKLESVNHHASSDGRIEERSTPPAESKQDNLDAQIELGLSVKDRVRALALRIQPRDETVPIGRSSQATAVQANRSTADTVAFSKDKTKSTSPTHEKTHGTTRQSLVMGAYLAAMAKSPPRYDDKGSKTQSTDISVDVPSIRSKFESSILSHEEEQDDESVSVKSRRSLFEVEVTEHTKESEVGKMRAMFESKKPIASQAKGFKGNGALKDAWAKFEASSSPPSDIALKRKVQSTQSTQGKQFKNNNDKGKETLVALDTSKDLSNAKTSLGGKSSISQAHPDTCQPADHLLPVADDSRNHLPFGVARKARQHDTANDNDCGALARKSEVPTAQIDTENYAVVSETEGKHFEMVASLSGIKSDTESRQKPTSDKVGSDRSNLSETRQSEGGMVNTASPSKTMATTPAPKVNANVTPFSKRLLVHNRFKSFARNGRYAAMTIKSESGAGDAVETPTKPQNGSTNTILLKQQEEKSKAVQATSESVLQVTSKAVETNIKNGSTAAKAQPITGTSQSDTKSAGARQNGTTVVDNANDHTNNDRSNVSGDKIVNIIPRDAVAVSTKPLKPEAPDRRPEECRSDSDYSDGVTLDVSIADVSCLTNPTAFRSKEGNSFQSASHSSSKSSFVADLMEAEAKQSEASSSQTSEAAAPLLAAALGLRRSSDDASAFDGFFSSRFLSSSISKWEHLARGDNLARDEKEPVVKPSLDIGKDSGWDLQHIRDSNSPASFRKDSFAKFDTSSIDWNAFLADSRLRKSQPSPVDFIQNPSRSVTPQARPSVSIMPRTEFLSNSSRQLGVTRSTTPRSVTPTRQLTPTRPQTPTTPTMSLTPARPITPSSGNASRISHNMDGVRQSPRGVQMDALSHSNQRSSSTPSRSTNTPSTAYSSHSHHSYMLPSVSPTARSPYASSGVSTTTTTRSTSPHSRSPRATSTHSAPHYIGCSYQSEANWGGMSHSSTPLSHFPLSNVHMTPPVKIAAPPAPASDVGQTYYMSEGSTKTPSSLRRASPKHAALMSRMRSVKEARLLRNASPIGTPSPVAASLDLIGTPTMMNSVPPRESPHVPPTMSSSQIRASVQQHRQKQQQPQQQQQPPPTYSTSYRPTSSVGLQVPAFTANRPGPGLPRYLPSVPPPPLPTSYRSYHTASTTTALPPRREPHRIEDELSNSTRSSTRFGGINFDTLLEVD